MSLFLHHRGVSLLNRVVGNLFFNNMSEFYQTSDWRLLREKVLSIYGSTCMSCGNTPEQTGKSPHVDHIRPRSAYPHLQLDIRNLQVLCENCNCEVKGINVVDYRTHEHLTLLKRKGNVRLEKTDSELILECKNDIMVAMSLPAKKRKNRLRCILEKTSDENLEQIMHLINSKGINTYLKTVVANIKNENKRRQEQSKENGRNAHSKKQIRRLHKLTIQLNKAVNKSRPKGIQAVKNTLSNYKSQLSEQEWRVLVKRCNIKHLV